MIDHIDLPVRDIAASRDFYTAALAPLGYTPGPQLTATVGCLLAPVPGGVAAPVLWLHEDPEARGDVHVAFTAADRATVHAFHQAARAAGGKDNGAPRERPEYARRPRRCPRPASAQSWDPLRLGWRREGSEIIQSSS